MDRDINDGREGPQANATLTKILFTCRIAPPNQSRTSTARAWSILNKLRTS